MEAPNDKVFLLNTQWIAEYAKLKMVDYSTSIPISFGDCDPAGIVFYPNTYRWFDHLFHDWLRQFGGHARICERFDAVGTGLLEAGSQFLYPMRDGDLLVLHLTLNKWTGKTLRLHYEGFVGPTLCVTGHEVRALFRRGDTGMIAADISAFREMVERGGGKE